MGSDEDEYKPTPLDPKATDEALRFTGGQQGVFGGRGKPLKVENIGGLDPARIYHYTLGSDSKIYGEGDVLPEGPSRELTIKAYTLDGVPLVTINVYTPEPDLKGPQGGPMFRVDTATSTPTNYELESDQGKGFRSDLLNEHRLNLFTPQDWTDAFRGTFNNAQNKGLLYRFSVPADVTASAQPLLRFGQALSGAAWWDRFPSLSVGWNSPWNLASYRLVRTSGCGCGVLSVGGAISLLILLGAALGLCEGPVQPETENASIASAGPELSAISATFARPDTTYTVRLTASDATAFKFSWQNTNPCGVFPYDPTTGVRSAASQPVAVWHHPDDNTPGHCPPEPVHPGTITVTATDGHYTCSATYPFGSLPAGAGQPGSCTGSGTVAAVSSPPPPKPAFPWPWIAVSAVLLGAAGVWAWRGGVLGSRAGVALVDPCEKERAWVAELRARIAAMEQEYPASVSRGDTYLPPNLRGSLAIDRDLLRKAEALLARCEGFDVPDPYAPVPAGGAVAPETGEYMQRILDGIHVSAPLSRPDATPETNTEATTQAGPGVQAGIPMQSGQSGPQVPSGPPQANPQDPAVPIGPVVPAPNQQTTNDEKPHAHCGPQVDKIFVDALNRTLERLRTIFGPEPDQATGMEFMARNGWDLDFFADPPLTCQGPHCPATITLCGQCHQHHILSDFMYGFVAGYFGLTEAHADMGGLAYQVFKVLFHDISIDPAHYTEARPAYHSGVTLGQLLTMTAEERMVTVDDLCLSRTGEQLGAVAIRMDCPPAPCVATHASKDFSTAAWSWDTPILTTPRQAHAIKGSAH